MENKKAYNIKALKHIICCLILLLIFVISISKVDAKSTIKVVELGETEEVIPLKPYSIKLFKTKLLNKVENKSKKYNKPRIIEKNINFYIESEIKTLTFFANTFGFDIEFVKEDLIKRSENMGEIINNNIGSLKNEKGELIKYNSIEYGIVEYFCEIAEIYPEKQNKKWEPYNGNSDYVEKLIMYYTTIYTDVDATLALSIGAAESGYYQVKYMLSRNNVYGGMSSRGLITYNNIEIGVLKYIRLLNNGYFKKGLTTPESIGKVYCPTYNEFGTKIASPHWINLVYKAKSKYNEYNKNIKIDEIINYEEVQ